MKRITYSFLLLFLFFSIPSQAQDTDDDGISDVTDLDDDNDGITDVLEALACQGKINYEYYDVSPTGNTVDNIPTTGAMAEGSIDTFDVDFLQGLVDPADPNNFSIRYSGAIYIASSDTYTFFTNSDDGSKLYVNGTEVVDNDGAHGPAERQGTIFLNVGWHSLVVEFFERTGGEILDVNYSSGTIAKTSLPFNIIYTGLTCDADGDGLPNNLDLDSDGDGIPDNVEAQGTNSYIAPSGIDSDGNGLDDAYESTPGNGEGLSPVNTVANTLSDFGNLDSDGDGFSDSEEAGLNLLNTDTDGDGLDDSVDTTNLALSGPSPDYTDANGNIDDPQLLPNNQNASSPEVDFRDFIIDTDNDGVQNTLDVDDDNDGIFDTVERDCHGELTYEYYDNVPTGNTVDNIPTTGAIDIGTFNSFDVDALQTIVDPGDTNRFAIRYTGQIFIAVTDTYTFYTSSDDGSKLFIDGNMVVDNDGLHSVRERFGTILLNAGYHEIEVLFFENNGGEFLSVSYESSTIAKVSLPFGILAYGICDMDNDGIPNALDSDSDNDGCNDVIEAYDDFAQDPDVDGIFGIGPPSINPDGSVASAPYTTPVDGNGNGTPEFLEIGPGLPSIVSQPVNSTICLGCTGTFVVGSSADTFQWQTFDGISWVDLTNSSIYTGVNTNSLNVLGTESTLNARLYRAVVKNTGVLCPILSDTVQLNLSVDTVISNRRITHRVNRN